MFRRLFIVVCVAGLFAATAQAADLWTVWQLATKNDPAFLKAKAQRNASMQAEPLAWSRVFPSVDLGAGHTWTNATSSSSALNRFTGGVLTSSRARNTTSSFWSATLTQTLFNWKEFMAIQGADMTVAKARADYEAALQQLMVKVSQAYFNVLEQNAILEADVANLKALQRQYKQAQQKYDVGLIAITGVRQAQAAFEQARARVIRDRRLVAQAREALRAITGRYLANLEAPQQDLPLIPPRPSNVDAWINTAMEENPGLASVRFAQKIAENQVAQQRSGYMPKLNLQLQHRRGFGGGNSSFCRAGSCLPASPVNSLSSTNTISLSLSWNVFNGGGTRAAVKRQMFQADAALATQINQRRTVIQNVRNAYLAVISGIAQVKATKQAVIANRISLKATKAGLKVGTQTTLDVLTARQRLLNAKKSFFSARYNYLMSVLKLEHAAGTLSPKDLKHLSTWLGSSASAARTTPAPVSLSAAYPAGGPEMPAPAALSAAYPAVKPAIRMPVSLSAAYPASVEGAGASGAPR